MVLIRVVLLCTMASFFLPWLSEPRALAQSMNEASQAYQRGDYDGASRILKIHADRGDAIAQSMLGSMHAKGLGVPEDDAQAVKWFRRAADQGEAFAQYNLGVMYMDGAGLPKDFVQAYKWFFLAASRITPSNRHLIGKASGFRDLAWMILTPPEQARARKLVQEWQPKKER